MQKNIFRKFKLGIISDTRMFLDEERFINESVLREVNSFAPLFNQIIWLGYHYQGRATSNTSNKILNNVEIKLVPSSGGNSFLEKVKVLFFIPYYFLQILKVVLKSDIIHTRGPSIPALITILISYFFPKKIFWHKYAGDWQRISNTLSYRFQANLLYRLSHGIIVVSKKNHNDSKNILEWNNPCIYKEELKGNREKAMQKHYLSKLTFCFVGRIEDAKGFHLVQNAFGDLLDSEWIDKVHCVGACDKELTLNANKKFIYHGLINRASLDSVYEKSHFIILPSVSEGFPKVLIEAASFGCIPIVSSLESIIYHINKIKNNGFLLDAINTESLIDILIDINKNRHELDGMKRNVLKICDNFTYEKYTENINNIFLSRM